MKVAAFLAAAVAAAAVLGVAEAQNQPCPYFKLWNTTVAVPGGGQWGEPFALDVADPYGDLVVAGGCSNLDAGVGVYPIVNASGPHLADIQGWDVVMSPPQDQQGLQVLVENGSRPIVQPYEKYPCEASVCMLVQTSPEFMTAVNMDLSMQDKQNEFQSFDQMAVSSFNLVTAFGTSLVNKVISTGPVEMHKSVGSMLASNISVINSIWRMSGNAFNQGWSSHLQNSSFEGSFGFGGGRFEFIGFEGKYTVTGFAPQVTIDGKKAPAQGQVGSDTTHHVVVKNVVGSMTVAFVTNSSYMPNNIVPTDCYAPVMPNVVLKRDALERAQAHVPDMEDLRLYNVPPQPTLAGAILRHLRRGDVPREELERARDAHIAFATHVVAESERTGESLRSAHHRIRKATMSAREIAAHEAVLEEMFQATKEQVGKPVVP